VPAGGRAAAGAVGYIEYSAGVPEELFTFTMYDCCIGSPSLSTG